jgi:hypothetical protein
MVVQAGNEKNAGRRTQRSALLLSPRPQPRGLTPAALRRAPGAQHQLGDQGRLATVGQHPDRTWRQLPAGGRSALPHPGEPVRRERRHCPGTGRWRRRLLDQAIRSERTLGAGARRRAHDGRAARLAERVQQLEAALSQARKLEDVLPICPNCKCICSDQNYWLQVEEYLAKNTALRLTHGICPACISAIGKWTCLAARLLVLAQVRQTARQWQRSGRCADETGPHSFICRPVPCPVPAARPIRPLPGDS